MSAGMEWQPIETAPKDGTVILLAEPNHDGSFCIATGRWVEPYIKPPYWGDGLTDDLLMDGPTHWSPLPEAPK